MTQSDDQPGTASTCPFCHAPWSAAMFARYDAAVVHEGCACCPGEHRPASQTPERAPSTDIVCDSCNRPIYRAVTLSEAQS